LIAKEVLTKKNGGMFSEIDKNGCWVLLVMMAQCALFFKEKKAIDKVGSF